MDDVVTPLRDTIETLAARMEECECDQGATMEVSALKAAIAILRSDTDQLKCTNIVLGW